MKHYKLVFLDLDETLMDFKAAERSALVSGFHEYGLELTDDTIRLYEAKNTALWKALERGEVNQEQLKVERFRQVFQELGWAVDPASFSEVFIGFLSRGIHFMPGAVETCTYLAARYRLAIVTNGIAAVQYPRILDSSIAPYIEAIIVSEEAGCGKPNPAIFEFGCRRLGLHDKAAMLMVGDSLASDIQGAVNFGIDSCWLNISGMPPPQDGPQPNYEIASLAELRELL
jgi:YjjG family noncanonical pyrimidine nucleotidase